MSVPYLSGHMALEEIDEPHGLLLFREVEIHTVLESHDVEAVRVSVVLQKQLLQVVEGSLVSHSLTHLHNRVP